MDKVESYEFQSFKTNNRTFNNLNVPNKDTEFDIDIGYGFIQPYNADCYVTFEVIGRDANGTFAPNTNM
jgi:hypothetical protein